MTLRARVLVMGRHDGGCSRYQQCCQRLENLQSVVITNHHTFKSLCRYYLQAVLTYLSSSMYAAACSVCAYFVHCLILLSLTLPDNCTQGILRGLIARIMNSKVTYASKAHFNEARP